MNIPNLVNHPFVDKEGNLHPAWRYVFDQLFSQLQTHTSEQGFWIPNQPTEIITQLNQSRNGNLIYDTNIKKLKVKVDETYETIPSS